MSSLHYRLRKKKNHFRCPCCRHQPSAQLSQSLFLPSPVPASKVRHTHALSDADTVHASYRHPLLYYLFLNRYLRINFSCSVTPPTWLLWGQLRQHSARRPACSCPPLGRTPSHLGRPPSASPPTSQVSRTLRYELPSTNTLAPTTSHWASGILDMTPSHTGLPWPA